MITTGRVYIIKCMLPDVHDVYIGSTFKKLTERFRVHKSNYKSYLQDKKNTYSLIHSFDKYGVDNFKIFLYKEYQVYRENKFDNKHLKVYEQLLMVRTKNKINIQPCFSIERLTRRYKWATDEEHREKALIRHKKYLKDNKEAIKKQRHEHYVKNRQRLIANVKENTEKNKEQKLQYLKEYREKNKEELKLKRSVKITCICGSHILKTNIKIHETSKKHINFIKQL